MFWKQISSIHLGRWTSRISSNTGPAQSKRTSPGSTPVLAVILDMDWISLLGLWMGPINGSIISPDIINPWQMNMMVVEYMLDVWDLRISQAPIWLVVKRIKFTFFCNSIWNDLNLLICFRRTKIEKKITPTSHVLSSCLLIKPVQFADSDCYFAQTSIRSTRWWLHPRDHGIIMFDGSFSANPMKFQGFIQV